MSERPSYRVEIKSTALKALSKIPAKHRAQIEAAIDGLALQPRPPGVKKLAGEQTLHRIYSGVYRIIYDIFDDRICVCVVRIGHRKDVYRNL
jgi:mRNA interferase RelE/StbE